MAKMEEYYKLDAEDFIDDMPCRFKYKQVAPSMYGLSTKEMLAMSDRQLTQIMPLKKLAPYRHDSDMQTDVKVKARAQRMAREFIAEDAKRAKERKKNKGKKKKKGGGGDDDDSDSDGEDADAVAAAAAEERKSSYAAKAWGKHNMDNKPGRKRKVDTAEDADAGDGHHPAAAAAAQVEEKMAAASNNTPAAGQGKNAKKNAKKRMKKNQAEAAKAAGMI
jgi:protein KRI1